MYRILKAHRDRREWSDEGFTLVELLIVIVIMPLVIGAIALGLVSVFKLQTSVTQRLSGSTDLQSVTATYARDVQSSKTIFLGTSPQQCGASGVQLLGLQWSGGKSFVSYVRVQMSNSSTNYAFERLFCTLGDYSNPVQTTVMSSDFYLTNASLTQDPPAVCTTWPPSPANCQSATSANPSLSFSSSSVAAVTFSMYVPMTSAPYTMVASPRGGSGAIGSNGPFNLPSPLTLLGTSCTDLLTVAGSNNGHATGVNINVDGGTGNGTLGLAYCPASAISLSNNGVINASGVVTGVPSDGGITVSNHPGTYPTSVNYASGMSDPFTALPPPAVPTACGGAGQIECGSCSHTSSGGIYYYTCSAGLYLTSPAFSHNPHITFAGAGGTDETVFGTDFYLPNGTVAKFGSGVYVFAAPDSAAFDTGTSGVSVYGNGVLFYTPTGSMSFENNSSANLSAIGSPNSLNLPYYDGISVWLGGTLNTTTGDGILTLNNNGTSTYGGVYVPNGEVVASNNGTLVVTFIVASSASFSSGITVDVIS